MRQAILLMCMLLLSVGVDAQGIYTQVKAVNVAGVCSFPGTVLMALPAIYEFVPKRGHPEGEVVVIRLVIGGAIIIDDVLIHRNGRAGGRNLALDTIILSIDQLANIPADLQLVLAAVERLPSNQTGRITVRGR